MGFEWCKSESFYGKATQNKTGAHNITTQKRGAIGEESEESISEFEWENVKEEKENKRREEGEEESCFVFNLCPHKKRFLPTKLNDRYVLSNEKYIAFGGESEESFSFQTHALTLDCSMEYGTSECAETFMNDCLASDVNFQAVLVELFLIV